MNIEDYNEDLMDEDGFCNHDFIKTGKGLECRGCGMLKGENNDRKD
jgi:hypothetical protein